MTLPHFMVHGTLNAYTNTEHLKTLLADESDMYVHRSGKLGGVKTCRGKQDDIISKQTYYT